ncbi:hypothetical protein JOJ88_004707 [Pantoea cypripedii]|nr:hypothetical protein [Pantoea cypripedii]
MTEPLTTGISILSPGSDFRCPQDIRQEPASPVARQQTTH